MIKTSSGSDHYYVRDFFRNRGRVAQLLSATLNELYRLRADADYSRDERTRITTNPPAAAQQALNLSNKAIELIGYLQPKK